MPTRKTKTEDLFSGSGQTVSSWLTIDDRPSLSPLDHDISTDVCVIGAGIAGLSTAYLLGRRNRNVVVLDDGPIGGGMTERTTAHLATALDDRYVELEKLHGEEGARLAAASHAAAIDWIEAIVKEEKIKCEFERLDGYLFVPPRKGKKILHEELAAAKRAGLTDLELVERAPLDYDTGPAIRFPRQAQFHPLKYLRGLGAAIERHGNKIFTGTHAQKISGGRNARVETSDGHVIKCSDIVVATNSPVNDKVAIHTKQAAYQTYVIAARVEAGSVTKALYWDTADPYHYVRLQRVGRGENAYDLLIVGGEDHKTGQKNDGRRRFKALERWTRARFRIGEIEYRWSGEVMEPIDGLAFIGRNPLDANNVFIATGDSGHGMTHGTIAGILISDLIISRKNEWEKLYDPSRITLRALPSFAKENLNVMMQYADFLKPSEVDSFDLIRKGTGGVVLTGSGRVAAYRDEEGELHQRSAVCPHLGCLVNWNSVEKSWDCPCHGSRFDCMGKVFQGPANNDLAPVEKPVKSLRRTRSPRRKRVA